jgi:hypothetical protein
VGWHATGTVWCILPDWLLDPGCRDGADVTIPEELPKILLLTGFVNSVLRGGGCDCYGMG